MNPPKIFRRRVLIWEKAILLFGAIGYAFITYKYRTQMGDFGDFVKAGKLIWENVDPYSQLMYVNSPVSAVVVYSLSKAIPFLFVPAFWQLLNILGLAFFIRTVVKPEFHSALPVVFSIFAFLNVTRALFANVQVTGMVLGLIAIGITLNQNGKSTFFSMLPIWIAAEVKPQLALGFIAVFLFQGQIQKLRILALGLYVLLGHVIVELKFNGDINRLWVQKLLKYSSASLKEGYEISYWKSLAIFSGQTSIIRILSILFLIATLVAIIALALKRQLEWALFLAIVFPLQNTYLHLYDLAPIGVLFVLSLYSSRDIPLIIGTCIFLQFFPLAIETQVLVAIVFSLMVLLLKAKEQRITRLLLLLSTFLCALAIVFYLLGNQSQELQMANSLVAPAAVLLAINSRKFVALLDSRFSSR
jgi:hypothetical protein